MNCQMIRVISSPSSSTTVPSTLILLMTPLRRTGPARQNACGQGIPRQNARRNRPLSTPRGAGSCPANRLGARFRRFDQPGSADNPSLGDRHAQSSARPLGPGSNGYHYIWLFVEDRSPATSVPDGASYFLLVDDPGPVCGSFLSPGGVPRGFVVVKDAPAA